MRYGYTIHNHVSILRHNEVPIVPMQLAGFNSSTREENTVNNLLRYCWATAFELVLTLGIL